MASLQEQCVELLPVVQAGAEGKKIEYFDGKKWLRKTEPGFLITLSYRVAEETHEVNGFTVPAPADSAPKLRTEYWIPQPPKHDWVVKYDWNDDAADQRLLLRGLVFLTRDAARRNSLAMLGLDPEKETDHGY